MLRKTDRKKKRKEGRKKKTTEVKATETSADSFSHHDHLYVSASLLILYQVGLFLFHIYEFINETIIKGSVVVESS